MNYLRDLDNPEDIALGTIAASHGEWLRKGIISPKEVSTVATYALDARLALWPADSPQFRAQQWWRWLR